MIAERALKTLEYDKVRQQVASYCTSSIGKSAIEELVPQTDFDKVVQLLEEMDEDYPFCVLRAMCQWEGFLMSAHLPDVLK